MEQELNLTFVSANISSTPESPSLDKFIPALVLSFCFLLGVPGNVALLIFKLKHENENCERGLSHTLIVNLATSDLLCLLTLPLWIYSYLDEWTFGIVACKTLAYLAYCSVNLSLLTVTALSVQRYIQVVYLKRVIRKGKRRLLLLLWSTGFIFSIHALLFRQIHPNLNPNLNPNHNPEKQQENRTRCSSIYPSPLEKVAVLTTESVVWTVCFSVMAFAYARLHRSVNQTAFFNNPRTTHLVTVIILACFILWTPYVILNVICIVAILREDKGLLERSEKIEHIFGALTFVNSCVNPMLYAYSSGKMSAVWELWKQKCCRIRSPQPSSSSSALDRVVTVTGSAVRPGVQMREIH